MGKLQKEVANADFWMVVHSWLYAYGIKLNKNYLKSEITTHPDYPSLLSVIDFLESGGMAYKAIHTDASYIHELNYPLLAHIKQPGDERILLVRHPGEWTRQEAITRHWSGIVVYPEIAARWNNEQHTSYHRNEIKNRMLRLGFLVAGVAITAFSLFQHPHPLTTIFGILSLAGLAFSFFALGAELGFQSELVKQVCGAVSPGGCERVLKSPFAKGIGGVTPADASVLYFSAQYILFIAGCYRPDLFQPVLLLALAGIPVAAVSIYFQAIKIRKWCAICLSIASVLFIQGGIALMALPLPIRSILPGALFVALLFVLSLTLFAIKQLIRSNSSNKLKLAELKKWKLDAGLFMVQWQQEQESDTANWENDLLIGEVSAPILITVACNPYCGPCSKEHRQLDELLQRAGGKVKVQLRLAFHPEDADDRRAVAARAILQKASTIKSNIQLRQMLTDWFEWMDYNKWAEKWQPDPSIDVEASMRLHSRWMDENKISYTPTSFINGKKLPGKYSLSDVELLISPLAEIFEKKAADVTSLNVLP